MPRGITHESARDVFNQVRKEMPKLTDAAWRREAARRMDVDYDTYLKAWKKQSAKPVMPAPNPVLPKPDVPDLPKPAPVQPQPVTPTLTHETARQQHKLVKKEFPTWTDAQVRHEAARRMNVDYDTYLRAWKKPKDYKAPKPNTPHTPAAPTIRMPSVTTPKPVRKSLWKTKDSTRQVASSSTTKSLDKLTQTYDKVAGGYKYHLTGVADEFARIAKRRNGVGNIEYMVSVRSSNRVRRFNSLDEADGYIRRFAEEGEPDFTAVNPGYGLRGTTNNCPSTTTTWELRRRGYDVVARTMSDGAPLLDIFKSWGVRRKHMIGRNGPDDSVELLNEFNVPTNDWDIWKRQAADLPDGARGFVNVFWKKGGAHIYNWEVRDGKLWYIDAQPGREWDAVNDTYEDRANSYIYVVRVDEIEETDSLNWLTSDQGQKKTRNPWSIG